MNHTASNRELVWRLLQGGELIAPVPPLPPRETPDDGAGRIAASPKSPGTESVSETQAPPSPIKKTRARKKTNAASHEAAEPGSVAQADPGATSAVTSPKRGRKKKNVDEAGATIEMEVRTPSASTDPAPQVSTDASAGDVPPTKPKRTRRVGEPKPKLYPVGEQEAGA